MTHEAESHACDSLDGLCDELVAAAVAGASGDTIDATSALMVAGFILLMESIGPAHAVAAMRSIVDGIVQRVAN